jgi:nicotinate phosphoribosyltransferase
MNGLLTDLYQLTMAAGFFESGKQNDIATFELFFRRLPRGRNFIIAAGLEQAVDYLLNFRFEREEIEYLRGLPQFARVSSAFFDMLAELRFTGDLFAAPEGTPIFPGEPFLTVRAPLLEAQIPETYLLSTIGFQSMIATKAARFVHAARGGQVVEFGTRRAHSPEAGTLAARAAYIGGAIGTSNTLAGFRYGLPVFGTAAHSWVMSFATEREAFARLQQLMGPMTVHLIDSYDTLEGARTAASLGQPLWGVRLDSGDLESLTPKVRAILDEAGLKDAKIMATGDLDEYKISELCAAGVPIDLFGAGTDLSTSSDSPKIGVVYKLVELESNGVKRYTLKLSEDKATLPGAKQIFRYPDHDVLGLSHECIGCPDDPNKVKALLRPAILKGRAIGPRPTAAEARQHAAESLARLPLKLHSLFEREPYPVEQSSELRALTEQVRQGLLTASV